MFDDLDEDDDVTDIIPSTETAEEKHKRRVEEQRTRRMTVSEVNFFKTSSSSVHLNPGFFITFFVCSRK